MNLILTSIFLILSFATFSQNGSFGLGARVSGIAGAASALDGPWLVFSQPAGIANLQNPTVLAGYQLLPQVVAFNTLGAAYMQRSRELVWGASVYRFGDDVFSEQRVGATIAHRLDRVSLGLSVQVVQIRMAGLQSRQAVSFDFGGQADLTSFLRFGAVIHHLNQPRMAETGGFDERLPVIMRAGFSVDPLPDHQLLIQLDTEKHADFEESFLMGIEYWLIPKLAIRSGLRTKPLSGHYGLGWKLGAWMIDYAFSNQGALGEAHEVSMMWRW